MSDSPAARQDLSTRPWKYQRVGLTLLVILILLAGLIIRLYDLDDPPLDFHPVRQLHSALIARGWFASAEGEGFSAEDRQRVIALGQGEAIIEPPILEAISTGLYQLVGREDLRIPRSLSSIFWLVGGLAVFALARAVFGWVGGLAALAFMVILPYGIFGSRTFQPDPLMVALAAASLWCFHRWAQQPNWKNAIFAGVLIGFAILVKQVIVFILLGGALGLLLPVMRLRDLVRSRQAWLIGGLAVLPVLLYNLYGLLAADFLTGQFSLRFFPRLWTDPAFYIRWARQIDQTVGMVWFLLAAAGIALVPSRRGRGLLIGLLAGYLVYGFTLAYHISTHDYYHLPLIPITALGLAPLAEWIWQGAARMRPAWFSPVFLAVIALGGCLFSLYDTRQEMKRVDYRAEPALWHSLGEAMRFDSGGIVGLFDDYGVRMQYYGMVRPSSWMSTGDLEMRALAGTPVTQAEFEDMVEGKSFFMVTDLEELAAQPVLRAALEENYPVFQQGEGYIIYDLRPENR